jgi:hypothetical protein
MWRCCDPVGTEHNQKGGCLRERREEREKWREDERGHTTEYERDKEVCHRLGRRSLGVMATD